MRYVKHFIEDIAGIEVYPMISLLIFFIFFLVLTVYVVTMRKQHANYMAARPIDLDDTTTESKPS
ncbi:MAG: CcoQ/FixQ family Cbb3-type cytochrome c oxidase assembly chaperone [Bacteroidia bacterium]